ncbi:MAG: GIY-YIG nuclease family protein [bacterium]|nr:GIY-YIG nuclease family protein [bacterium]
MYYVYMLLCKDDTIYTGITTDVDRRLREHRRGIGSNYTRARHAEKILYTERCADRSVASKREAVIKKMSKAEKLALVA